MAGGGFHPSFGQPHDEVCFRPKRLASRAAAEDAPQIIVRVPPAAVHALFAHRQWRAGMLMADALYSGALPASGRTVVELGAGTALPSLVSALCGAACVAATDYDDAELISALRRNTQRSLAANESRTRFAAMGQTWGHSCEDVLDWLPGSAGYDVVLLADCTWDPFSHADLLKSCEALLAHARDA